MKRLSLAWVMFPALCWAMPQPTGWVVDEAKIVDATREATLTARAERLAQGEGPEIAVVTITSLQGDTIEHYAIKVAEAWKVGKRTTDNGVIFLVAHQDRQMRIEVGRGAEAELTDAEAKRILERDVKPLFKTGKFSEGCIAAFDAIEKELTHGRP